MKNLKSVTVLLSLLLSLANGNVVVEGTIVDSKTNEPVIGANILIVGTNIGTSTDKDGNFKIQWAGDYPVTIQVSHIAYMTREVEVSYAMPLKIRLVSKVLKGEEVIVTGERSRTQAEVSTALDILDIEDIELQGSRDVGSALRRISSVVIDQSSSGVQTVSIRGSNANEVAVYLDGVKINSANTGVADLSQIDLNSIQRIEVLRGGSAYLFGQGNLGGILNLETREAMKNSLLVNWGEGLSFVDDLDLSISGTGVLGPIGFGGRFSGRSRAYAGRTLTSSVFNNLFSDVKIPNGKINGRWYQMKNMLTYPSGAVASGDQQTIVSARYRGNILRFDGWEIFGGGRFWSETNNFFDNLDQKLEDRNLSYRISKAFRLWMLDATLQLENEDQTFIGDRTTAMSDINIAIDSRSILSRNTSAFALVTRWIAEGGSPKLRRMQVEVSARLDRIDTKRSERQETYSMVNGAISDELLNVMEDSGKKQDNFVSKRIGLRMEGLTNKFGYTLFFSQGNNRRLPTLNDLFLKANTSIDSLRIIPLETEYMNSTELNLQCSFTEFLTTSVISELKLSGAFFRNNYDNKIGYLTFKGLLNEPPVPYNELKADIRGFETGVLVSFFDDKFRFQFDYTILDVENPFIFSNRPGFRKVMIFDLDIDWLVVSYDVFKEGEQFVMGTTFGRLFEPRENSNLTITLRKELFGVKWSLSYIIRNLMSKGDKSPLSDENILFFNYYYQYREIVTLRVSI